MPKGEKKAGGRPKKTRIFSERVKNNYLKAAAKIAKETGMTMEEHFLRMAIDPQVQPAARAAFAKLYNEALLVKESEQTITDNREGPRIGLPPVMAKPAAISQPEEEARPRLHG